MTLVEEVMNNRGWHQLALITIMSAKDMKRLIENNRKWIFVCGYIIQFNDKDLHL